MADENYLLLVCFLMYISMQLLETVSFSSKIAGKLSKRLSLGVTVQHTIYQSSRIPLPFLLIGLSFVVETGIEISFFLQFASLSLFGVFVVTLYTLRNVNNYQIFFQKVFDNVQKNTLPKAIFKTFFEKKDYNDTIQFEEDFSIKNLNFKKTIAACFAYIFLSTGFFISFSLAIVFNDYRMTVSQLTTAMHGIGALFLAYYIDPMFSKSLDLDTNSQVWITNFYSIFIGRLLAYLISSVFFFIFYINLL